MKKETEVINFLLKNNITISSIESCTGGLFGSTLVSYDGISKVYLGSLITYNLDIKKKLLKFKDEEIKGIDVISSSISKLMCEKGYKIFKSDLVVSFTGNAGPTLDTSSKLIDKDMKGVCYFTILYKKEYYTYRVYYPNLTRNNFRKRVVRDAFSKIYEILLKSLA